MPLTKGRGTLSRIWIGASLFSVFSSLTRKKRLKSRAKTGLSSSSLYKPRCPAGNLSCSLEQEFERWLVLTMAFLAKAPARPEGSCTTRWRKKLASPRRTSLSCTGTIYPVWNWDEKFFMLLLLRVSVGTLYEFSLPLNQQGLHICTHSIQISISKQSSIFTFKHFTGE